MTQTTEGQCGALETVGERVRDLRARFEAEIEPLRRPLWQYCQRLTGSPFDAEDLVQKTLQRGLARLANLWQAVDPRAYLFRIATNAWIDRRRKDVRAELEELTAELPAPDPSPELRVEAREAMAHLVAVLTPLQRVVFLLCDTLDFRAPEAAALPRRNGGGGEGGAPPRPAGARCAPEALGSAPGGSAGAP